MARRRTRYEKEHAKHSGTTVHWEPKSLSSEATVKGQFLKTKPKEHLATKAANSSYLLAQKESLVLIKGDIMKSLLYAVLIIGAEVMLYFIWQSK